MKKLLFVCLVIAVAFTNCKKDDSTPTYTKSQLVGKWKQIDPIPAADEDPYVVFTDSQISFVDTDNIAAWTVAYTFENQIVKYNFLFDFNWKVEELSSTKLVVTETIPAMSSLVPASKKTFTKQ